MHILYLDESGTHGEARHFVLAGLSVFERETYFLARQLEQLQEEFFPGRQHSLNLRASELPTSVPCRLSTNLRQPGVLIC